MKLITLNLWNINEPLDHRMRQLYGYLSRASPDVMAFQEVSFVDGIDQLSVILSRLGYNYLYVRSGSWHGREEGLVVASRYDCNCIGVIELPLAPNDMRRIAVLIETCGFTVINTHLAYHIDSVSFRRKQIRAILDAINDIGGSPIILCGDFNEAPNDGFVRREILNDGYTRFTDSWLYDDPGYTFSSKNMYSSADLWPDRRIDYIYLSEQARARDSSHLILTGMANEPICSDHYGLLVEVD